MHEIEVLKDCLSASLTVLVHKGIYCTEDLTDCINNNGYEGLMKLLQDTMDEIDNQNKA